jgi:hypothetical protein
LHVQVAFAAERRPGGARPGWGTNGRGGACGRRTAAVLGEVFDARGRTCRFCTVWVRGYEFARDDRPAHIIVVPDLVEHAGPAA